MSDDSRKFKAVDDDARVKRVKNSFVCEIASVEKWRKRQEVWLRYVKMGRHFGNSASYIYIYKQWTLCEASSSSPLTLVNWFKWEKRIFSDLRSQHHCFILLYNFERRGRFSLFFFLSISSGAYWVSFVFFDGSMR